MAHTQPQAAASSDLLRAEHAYAHRAQTSQSGDTNEARSGLPCCESCRDNIRSDKWGSLRAAEAVAAGKTTARIACVVVSRKLSHRGQHKACLMCWGGVHGVVPGGSAQS